MVNFGGSRGNLPKFVHHFRPRVEKYLQTAMLIGGDVTLSFCLNRHETPEIHFPWIPNFPNTLTLYKSYITYIAIMDAKVST